MENQAPPDRTVRQISERLRQHKRSRIQGCEVSLWCIQTALCISCIANYNFDLGVDWLTSKQRRGAPVHTDITHAALLDLLQEAFLSEADAHLNSWVDPPTSTLPLTVIKTAVAYAQGHGLASWVREKNIDCGSVVRTERLIEHYNVMNSIGPISTQVLCDVPAGKRSAGKMWASRWRRKHKVIVGSLNVRDPIDVGETWLKVGCMCLMNCMHIVSPLIYSDCGGTALCMHGK